MLLFAQHVLKDVSNPLTTSPRTQVASRMFLDGKDHLAALRPERSLHVIIQGLVCPPMESEGSTQQRGISRSYGASH